MGEEHLARIFRAARAVAVGLGGTSGGARRLRGGARRLEIIIDDLRREKFGSKSEKLTPDQFNLPLEDIEIAQGVLDAAQEKAEAIIKGKSDRRDRSRDSNRGCLPLIRRAWSE